VRYLCVPCCQKRPGGPFAPKLGSSCILSDFIIKIVSLRSSLDNHPAFPVHRQYAQLAYRFPTEHRNSFRNAMRSSFCFIFQVPLLPAWHNVFRSRRPWESLPLQWEQQDRRTVKQFKFCQPVQPITAIAKGAANGTHPGPIRPLL